MRDLPGDPTVSSVSGNGRVNCVEVNFQWQTVKAERILIRTKY